MYCIYKTTNQCLLLAFCFQPCPILELGVILILKQHRSQILEPMHLVSILSLLLLVGCTMSLPQAPPVRPFYVQSGSSYPKVLSRFNTGTDDSAVDSRLGEADANNAQASTAEASGQVDQDIMNRIATWPKELQPFWYVNSKAIADQRGQDVPCRNCLNSNVQLQPQPISPFIRPTSNRK